MASLVDGDAKEDAFFVGKVPSVGMAPQSSVGMREEVKALRTLIVPIVASTFLQVLMGIVDCMIVGHLGSKELAASALGNMWFNCVWFVTFGALSAVDTLASQAHGACRYEEVKHVVLRGSIVGTVLTVFMAIGLLQAEWVMTEVLQVAPSVAEMVGLYDRGLVLGLWPLTIFTVLQKYLQAINQAEVPVRVSALANVFNGVAGYVLVYCTPLRFAGAPLATSLSRIFMCVQLLSHVLRPSKHGYSHDLLKVSWTKVLRIYAFRDFIELAIPGAFMMSLEAWAFDATTLMAGLLHDTTILSAHTAALNLSGLTFFALPFGVGIACSIRVGNLLGAGKPEHARVTFVLSMAVGNAFMVVAAVVFLAFQGSIGYIFTQDTAVVQCLASIMPVVALYQVLDGFQGVAAGAMRGMGRQSAAAMLNFVGFWLVGVPSGYVLCFIYGWGLTGIWLGTCIGLTVLSLGQSAVLARNTDWAGLSAEVVARLARDRAMSNNSVSPLHAPLTTEEQVHTPMGPNLVRSPSLSASIAKSPAIFDESIMMAPILIIGAYTEQQETLRARALGDWILGTSFVLIVALIWTGATVLKQIIFWDLHFNHPFFMSYICNSCYMLNLFFFLAARAGGCLGTASSKAVRDDHGAFKLDFIERASPMRTAVYLGVMIAPIWFLSQWTYGAGVAATSVTSSTVISATSCAWTYLLSVVFLKESTNKVKLLGLGFCVLGNIATMYGAKHKVGTHVETIEGDGLCLLSALLYATYTTIIRMYVREDVPITIFFGLLGCVLFVGLSPLIWMYHSSLGAGLTMRLLGLMLLNGVFDNVLSQFLWAKAVLLTSPTVATVGLSLTIPLAVMSDLLRGIEPSGWSFISAMLVVMGFLAVNMGSALEMQHDTDTKN